MARKTVLVCDSCGQEVGEGKGATMRVNFSDARRGSKQADLCDKFLNESGAAFKESMYRENSYALMIRAYTTLMNWPKVMDAADKVTQLVPNAKVTTKTASFTSALRL